MEPHACADAVLDIGPDPGCSAAGLIPRQPPADLVLASPEHAGPAPPGLLAQIAAARDAARVARADAEQTRARLAMFEEMVRQAKDGMIVIDTDTNDPLGRIVYANPAFLEMTGYTLEEILGRPPRFLYGSQVDEAAILRQRAALDRGESVTAERLDYRPDGSAYWVELTLVPLFAGNGALQRIVSVRRDVTGRKHSEAALAHQATHDPLTGLPNRALLMDRLTHALAHRHNPPVAVLFLDLDRFKTVNDSLGHSAGDDLLRAVAGRLVGVVRGTDTLGRFGGDEFLICFEDADLKKVLEVARRIEHVLDPPIVLDGHEVVASVSMGVAVASPAQSAEGLLRDADTALYRAKELGRARVEVFGDVLRRRVLRRLDIEAGLRAAIDNGELRLVYQPIVEMGTGRAGKVEALLRWRRPGAGTISPNDFIPVAEETGLIRRVGAWAILAACQQAAIWSHLGKPREVAVNLSARQLIDDRVVEVVSESLSRTGLHAKHLWLEVTESAVMADPGLAESLLRRLRALGVRIAIDDFGTGYSSLGYLKRLPVEMLKVDGSFVHGLGRDTEDTAIVRGIVGLAHSLGLKVVAEGVETRTQHAELMRLGCDYAQGYLYGAPTDDPLRPLAPWQRIGKLVHP